MALQASTLEKELLLIADQASANTTGPAAAIAVATRTYGAEMMFPPPVGLGAAYNAQKDILESIPLSPPVGSVPLIELSFQVWAMQIMAGYPANPADGMGVPTIAPAGTPSLATIFSSSDSSKTKAIQMAVVIDTWVRSGTYDNGFLTFPGGSPTVTPIIVPWS